MPVVRSPKCNPIKDADRESDPIASNLRREFVDIHYERLEVMS
jgi:hypothetical protein